MHVIATAGHVDHGKSTLVRALTGMEPDRLAEERKRGLTIELGFAWTDLPSGRRLAFVDVPGHERFVTTMLAGVGPVPAVMFVVAADEGWCAQSTEHLAALDALRVSKGLLVVTRCDLADPSVALAEAREHLDGSCLAGIDAVTVSGRTGEGLDRVRVALDSVVAGLPAPSAEAPVRLWADRVFTISGAGTVVTGTLAAGTLRVGDELTARGQRVRVRGLQMLKEQVDEVTGVARIAVNLRGVARSSLSRGDPLLTPDAWLHTRTVDVATDREVRGGSVMLHIGSAAVGVRVRPLGPRAARLTLASELPLRVGDRALLRDPGAHQIAAGVQVLDVRPPALRRRGAATARAAELAAGVPDADAVLRRHGLLRRGELAAMGCPPAPDSEAVAVAGDWLADPRYWSSLGDRLVTAVDKHAADHPLDGGMPTEAARQALGLPDHELVAPLVRPPLSHRGGRISRGTALPPEVADAVARVREHLAQQPFRAPDADWLSAHGIGGKHIAAAARAGELLHLGGGVVLLPDAARQAASLLARLPQPFTVSEARRELDTTRRVAIPLLEHLDGLGATRRVDDTRRTCTPLA